MRPTFLTSDMEYNDIKAIVSQGSCKYTYRITYSDGSVQKKRLFISTQDAVCEFCKGSRRLGVHITGYSSWVKVEPVKSKTVAEVFARNLSLSIKYLEDSGFWPDILEGLKVVRKLGMEWVAKIYDDYGKLDYLKMQQTLSESGTHLSSDMFLSMFRSNFIRTINWSQHDFNKRLFEKAIAEKRKYNDKWRASYDNSVSYDPDGPRAWYSEEYKDCGNGHYYLLLDSKHCAFREDD